MWHGWVPSAASHMKESGRGRRENEREKDSREMHVQCIIYECICLFFLNNAFLLWCVNIQLHIFDSVCLAKTCVWYLKARLWCASSAVHLLWQYGFMTDAENHQWANNLNERRNYYMKVFCFVFIFLQYVFFFSTKRVNVCFCVSARLCVKVNVWSSASPCLIGNKTSRWHTDSSYWMWW